MSRIESGEDPTGIEDDLPDAHLFRVEAIPSELAKIGHYLQEGKDPNHYSEKGKKILTIKVAPFTLINGNLYKLGLDDVLCQCFLEHEREDIIQKAHSGVAGGHFLVETTIKNILQAGLWWPSINKDCKERISQCDPCQRLGQPLLKNEMPLIPVNPSLAFETWAIDFVGPFPKQRKKNWGKVYYDSS